MGAFRGGGPVGTLLSQIRLPLYSALDSRHSDVDCKAAKVHSKDILE